VTDAKTSRIFILLSIIILGSVLRFYGLDRQSFWYDEVFEITSFQRQFLGEKPMISPNTPPLNFLNPFFVYIINELFPNNTLALRMIPFMFGAVSVPLLFFLGKRLFNERVALIASYLLAISPFHIWYSQEVRMYALQWMLTLISLIFFLKALEKPNIKNYTGYVISTVLGLYTLQLTLFLIIIQGLYLLLFFKHHRARLSSWIVVFFVTVLLYSPWIIYKFLYLMDREISSPKETMPLMPIIYTFYSYFAGFSIGPSLRELHLNLSFSTIKPYIYLIVPLTITYGLMFLYGIFTLRNDMQRLVFLLLLSSIPIVGPLIVISTSMPKISYNVRYSGIASFGFILLISKGLEYLSQKDRRVHSKILAIGFLIIMTGFSGYSYWNYQFNPKYHKEDVRSAALYIKEHKKDGDVILVITSTCALSLNRYLDNNLQSVGYPPLNTNDKEEVIRELNKIVSDKNRIWLVLCREYTQKELVRYTKEWLDKNHTEIKELYRGPSDIANLTIHCYKLRTQT